MPSLTFRRYEECDIPPVPSEPSIEWYPSGLRPSSIPLTIVCGAPASGKSTYVSERAAPGDVVIDLDEIGAALSGEGNRLWDRSRHLGAAIIRRNELLHTLADRTTGAAWFIVGEPVADRRTWWADCLKPVNVVVIETPEAVCFARVKADAVRVRRYVEQTDIIARWWMHYTPRASDTVLRP